MYEVYYHVEILKSYLFVLAILLTVFVRYSYQQQQKALSEESLQYIGEYVNKLNKYVSCPQLAMTVNIPTLAPRDFKYLCVSTTTHKSKWTLKAWDLSYRS